tara:strand:- start:726 stop:905 length:180 start_codon:yes stop_codon:yes gene_type:complete
MKDDKIVFDDKIGAIEYITKTADIGRIEVKVVSKKQVEREKRIQELYDDKNWDWGCYKG